MAISEQDAGLSFPRRQGMKIRTDADALNVVKLLGQVAARVKHPPAITPPEGGMLRLGGMDRASYVWFLRCPEGFDPPAPVSGGGLCNHGLGVDRRYGAYEVRAWAHGAPGVHSVSLSTHTVTLEMLETAARLVGIPVEPAVDGDRQCRAQVALTIEGVRPVAPHARGTHEGCLACMEYRNGSPPAAANFDQDGTGGSED